MNVSEELQRLYVATLKANTAIMALANNVYDKVPTAPYGAKTAYISLGPDDATEDSADCVDGWVITTQLDAWSVKDGSLECKNLVDLIRKALHEKELALNDNALVEMRVVLTRTMQDPDKATTHGVVQVEARIEEPE